MPHLFCLHRFPAEFEPLATVLDKSDDVGVDLPLSKVAPLVGQVESAWYLTNVFF